jgi:hypothetical protein
MHTYRDSADLNSDVRHFTEWSVGYFEPAFSDGRRANFHVLSKHTTEKDAMRHVNYLNGGEGTFIWGTV